ncbi:MAG: type II toxin-antitoxin system VapC family toxin [Planctomycetota bacterium]|nr:MAG: type II toxin-antitoxin system VapC family toxin [Planctomycetota bacterium]
MTGYLLDTNILAELRKHDRCNPGVSNWFDTVDDGSVFLSVLVIGEVRRGVELLRRRDPAAAAQLDAWLHRIKAQFASRIIGIDSDICELWGGLGLQQPAPPIDGLLAATALFHDLVLVTRNVSDVQRIGVRLHNPFSRVV